MNIRVAQLNPTVGDIQGNLFRLLECLQNAENDHIDLLVVPELALLGYPPMDLLERLSFIERVLEANAHLVQKTQKTALVFGTITMNKSGKGRPIFNSALLAQHGKLLAQVHKTLLPTYDVFDEFRYFEPNPDGFTPIEFMGTTLGITICEDIWNDTNEIVYHRYSVDPMQELVNAGASLIVNLSASPFTKSKPELREAMLRDHAQAKITAIVYANQVGANTEVIFDGDSMMMNADGSVVERCELFVSDHIDAQWDAEQALLHPKTFAQPKPTRRPERIFNALVLGLKDYLRKSELNEKVVLGLSGGIDSALTAVVACHALGADNVVGITMPSAFSSAGSVMDSLTLAHNLGMTCLTLPINGIYEAYNTVLTPLFEGTAFNVAEENLQSRSRGVLLMAYSNKFGHTLLNTGNKSEVAVGYCTLYGDMAGGLSVLSDVYKTEVYDVCRWLNEAFFGAEIIPQVIIDKAPSAELRPNQKDSDSLPEYEVLDAILFRYVELQKSRHDIIREGFDESTVKRVCRMVDMNEYKRRQSAPGLRVSAKAFGFGRRLPIVQGWTRNE